MSVEEWHKRFTIQSGWTRPLREQLFTRIAEQNLHKVLEVGCGTGAVLREIASLCDAALYGCDLLQDFLAAASCYISTASLTQADAHFLPYPSDSFDLVYCHYLLLWVDDPSACVREMKRITRPGGIIAGFAEPDYGGRLDFPNHFGELKDHQIQGLRQLGADPFLGRKLPSLFSQSGLKQITSGVYQGSWTNQPSDEEFDSEWRVLQEDLREVLSAEEIEDIRQAEINARSEGKRVIFIPTFYAWGFVP